MSQSNKINKIIMKQIWFFLKYEVYKQHRIYEKAKYYYRMLNAVEEYTNNIIHI